MTSLFYVHWSIFCLQEFHNDTTYYKPAEERMSIEGDGISAIVGEDNPPTVEITVSPSSEQKLWHLIMTEMGGDATIKIRQNL